MTAGNVRVRTGIETRLSSLIQFATVSEHPGASSPEASKIRDGFLAQLEVFYPRIFADLLVEHVGEQNILLHWPAQEPTGSPLVLMAHYDVVPAIAADGWSHPPFSGVIANGWVYGRGALDDKGPMVVMLEAVENLLNAGFTPQRDIYLWLGSDEETNGAGAQAAVALFRLRGITPWMVLDEGGAITTAPLPFVAGTAAMVGVAEKGILTVRLRATADPGHASAPPRRTAIERVSRAVLRLRPSVFKARTPDAISVMLNVFALRSRGVARAFYRFLAQHPRVSAGLFSALGGEPAALVRTTVAPTVQAGGTAHNVLPSEASITLNLRIAPDESVKSTVDTIRRRIRDRRVIPETLYASEPSPVSDTQSDQFQLIRRAVKQSHPDAVTAPYVVMAATDSRYFHEICPQTFRFAPLMMTKELRGTIHGVDERVAVSELIRGEVFHRSLITLLTKD